MESQISLKNFHGKLKDIGHRAIEGLVNGIKEKWEALKGTIGNIADGIRQGFQEKLDIHSPSKVMRDEVGKNIILGIEEGFKQNLGASLGNMNNALLGGLQNTNYGKGVGNYSIVINTQELDSDKLKQIVKYVNKEFGIAY